MPIEHVVNGIAAVLLEAKPCRECVLQMLISAALDATVLHVMPASWYRTGSQGCWILADFGTSLHDSSMTQTCMLYAVHLGVSTDANQARLRLQTAAQCLTSEQPLLVGSEWQIVCLSSTVELQ